MKNDLEKIRTVKSIKTQARNSKRKTIFLDDGSFVGISKESLIANNIRTGDALSSKKIKELVFAVDKQKLKNSALKLLSYRMRSRAELKKRLLHKDFHEDDVEQLLYSLEKENLINDNEFAIAFSHDKIRQKRIGPLVLRAELLSYQLNEEIVDRTIQDIYAEYSVDSLLEAHLIKRNIKDNSHLKANEMNRLTKFLLQKGFDWTDVSRILQKHCIS